jgi:hypothetical protein
MKSSLLALQAAMPGIELELSRKVSISDMETALFAPKEARSQQPSTPVMQGAVEPAVSADGPASGGFVPMITVTDYTESDQAEIVQLTPWQRALARKADIDEVQDQCAARADPADIAALRDVVASVSSDVARGAERIDKAAAKVAQFDMALGQMRVELDRNRDDFDLLRLSMAKKIDSTDFVVRIYYHWTFSCSSY